LEYSRCFFAAIYDSQHEFSRKWISDIFNNLKKDGVEKAFFLPGVSALQPDI
jgi:hypothetical protein